MRLTDYTDYTLRTLIYLGLHPDELVTVRQISEAYGISNSHMTKVVHQLGQSGLVQTTRGRGGGLQLAVDPAQIGIGDVVRATEPDFHMVECFDKARSDCVLAPACELKAALRRATEAWLAVLDDLTLADLLAHPRKMRHQFNAGQVIRDFRRV
jgi:Rrf2 family nitric oxide-sensitive transcriptional repressor